MPSFSSTFGRCADGELSIYVNADTSWSSIGQPAVPGSDGTTSVNMVFGSELVAPADVSS
jgi:hypothetical protein